MLQTMQCLGLTIANIKLDW